MPHTELAPWPRVAGGPSSLHPCRLLRAGPGGWPGRYLLRIPPASASPAQPPGPARSIQPAVAAGPATNPATLCLSAAQRPADTSPGSTGLAPRAARRVAPPSNLTPPPTAPYPRRTRSPQNAPCPHHCTTVHLPCHLVSTAAGRVRTTLVGTPGRSTHRRRFFAPPDPRSPAALPLATSSPPQERFQNKGGGTRPGTHAGKRPAGASPLAPSRSGPSETPQAPCHPHTM